MGQLSLVVVATAGAALSAALTISLQNTDRSIAHQFTQSLNAPVQGNLTEVFSGQVAAAAPVSGSEDFWLSAMRAKDATGLKHAVAIGDKFTLSLGSTDEVFEVQSVVEIPSGVTYVGQNEALPHMLMVTARKPGDLGGKLLRFVIEQTPNAQADTDGRQARAL